MTNSKAFQTGRAFLEASLAPLLPSSWRIIPYDDSLDSITTPVVMFRVASFTKHPAAPSSTFLADWTLTTVAPFTDPARRDDAADDQAMQLVEALTAARIPWTDATKALWGTQYVCYDITTKLPTTRTPSTTEQGE